LHITATGNLEKPVAVRRTPISSRDSTTHGAIRILTKIDMVTVSSSCSFSRLTQGSTFSISTRCWWRRWRMQWLRHHGLVPDADAIDLLSIYYYCRL